jgi:uncharacterized protein YqgV (UPF0045/DUF77 family)
MILSAEITMYPLQDDYRPKIKAFIDQLAVASSLRRETFPTCTVLSGDHEELMALLSAMMKWSHETLGKAVFVVKFLPGYEAI